MAADFAQELDNLRARIQTLRQFVQRFAGTLERPFKDRAEGAYRFAAPEATHFCLLRACRVVSALNAMVALAEGGFTQEIGILFRIVYEAYTQIEATLAQIRKDSEVSGEVASFIADYFRDDKRVNAAPIKRSKLSQKTVNTLIGAELEPFSTVPRDDPAWRSTAARLAHLNDVFSNYVHGRYPETMDLYGGIPGRFHLAGMRHTPKDGENLETINTIITSVSHCFISVAQTLKLRELVKSDPTLAEWYQRLGSF